MGKKRKERFINEILTYTWECYDKIEEQYIEDNFEYNYLIDYLLTLNKFDRMVFILYCEYNSIQKVANETNIGKNIIHLKINEIKEELKKIIKDKKS